MSDRPSNMEAPGVRSTTATTPDLAEAGLIRQIGPAQIRTLADTHIAEVADFFADVFRPGKVIDKQKLQACLRETYLQAPSNHAASISLIEVDAAGMILGFQGLIRVPVRMGDTKLVGCIGGAFMARGPDRAKTALRILRSYKWLGLDFIISDTSNQVAANLFEGLGYDILPLQSLEWRKILRPVSFFADRLGRSLRQIPVLKTLSLGFGWIFAPLLAGLDRLASRLFPRYLQQDHEGRTDDSPISAEAFCAQAQIISQRFTLHLDWTAPDAAWLLSQAQSNTDLGPLQVRRVADARGTLLGVYLLYCAPGWEAYALQVICHPHAESAVVRSLVQFATDQGATAVRGRAAPHTMNGLRRLAGVTFRHNAACVLVTTNAAVRDVIRHPDALVGGLLGETWCRLTTDQFSLGQE